MSRRFRYNQFAVLPVSAVREFQIEQHITLSILDNFKNEDQQKMSNTDDERVCKFQLPRPSNKEKFYAFS